jgi:hypothetical protein
VAQDRDKRRALVNTIMNIQVQTNFGKFFSGCTTDDFSRRAQLHDIINGVLNLCLFIY